MSLAKTVHWRTLLASYRCECHFMKANVAALLWFLVWAILPLLKRKMYDQTVESLFWKQSRIRGN